jgi:hypothetical protein
MLSEADLAAIRDVLDHCRLVERDGFPTARTLGEAVDAGNELLAAHDALAAEVAALKAENAQLRKTAPRKGRTVLVLETDNAAAVGQRVLAALAAAGLMETEVVDGTDN